MYRTLRMVCLLLTGIFLLVSCQREASPGTTVVVSPLSPVATPSPVPVTGQVYVAQIRGAWASGAPYPVFFFEVPPGTTKVVVQEIIYGTAAPLGGVHPRLERLTQSVIWPGGNTSQVHATDFIYDERSGILLMFNATIDGALLDILSYDVFSCAGVGIAYLGDAGGANVFYNCASPISIGYQVMSTNEDGRPTEVLFDWECEGDVYEVQVEMTWGKSDPVNNIDVITRLIATITRE